MIIPEKVVYIAQTRDLFKIGHSQDPEKRMLTVKKSAIRLILHLRDYERPVVIHTIRAVAAHRVESALHWLFRQKRVDREWFALDSGDLAWIMAQTAQSILSAADAELDRVHAIPKGKRYKEMHHGHWRKSSEVR